MLSKFLSRNLYFEIFKGSACRKKIILENDIFLIIGGDSLMWNLLCHYYDQASAERRRPRCPCHRFISNLNFLFMIFPILSLCFIFERNCFEKSFLKKSRATKIIFRAIFKISPKLFSVLIFLFQWKLRILQFYSRDMWLFSIYDIRKTIYLDLGQLETCSNNQNSKLFLNWIFDKKYHLF